MACGFCALLRGQNVGLGSVVAKGPLCPLSQVRNRRHTDDSPSLTQRENNTCPVFSRPRPLSLASGILHCLRLALRPCECDANTTFQPAVNNQIRAVQSTQSDGHPRRAKVRLHTGEYMKWSTPPIEGAPRRHDFEPPTLDQVRQQPGSGRSRRFKNRIMTARS